MLNTRSVWSGHPLGVVMFQLERSRSGGGRRQALTAPFLLSTPISLTTGPAGREPWPASGSDSEVLTRLCDCLTVGPAATERGGALAPAFTPFTADDPGWFTDWLVTVTISPAGAQTRETERPSRDQF